MATPTKFLKVAGKFGGSVKSVNGTAPDENGNVEIEIPTNDSEWTATKKQSGGDFIYIPEQKVSGGIWKNLQISMQPGIIYDVTINGEVYSCEATAYGSGVAIGNNSGMTLNDYPFCIMWAGGTASSGMFFNRSDISNSVTLKVTDHVETEYNKMPKEYLPDCVVKSVNGVEPDANGNVKVKGGADIDVTAAVGQTIVVEEVDANGKPTKWKAADYQPRTHGKTFTELLPITTAVFNEEFGAFVAEFGASFNCGNNYTINWNGVLYNCVAVEMDGGVAVGNVDVLTGAGDSGEPFFIAAEEGMLLAIPLDGSAELTISVSGEIYQTIEKSYLPSDTMYGIPRYTGGAFDIESYCWREAIVTNLFYETSGFENTELTRAHFEVLEEAFANQIVFASSENAFIKASKNGDDWHMQFTGVEVITGAAYAYVKIALFRWSDTDNCVQRSVGYHIKQGLVVIN